MKIDPTIGELFHEPWRFEFAQAMRVLLRNSDHGETGETHDRRYDIAHEPVLIGAHQSLSFPASDIQSLTEDKSGEKTRMLINFLGLTGPSGVLPLPYTEFLMGRDEGDKIRIPKEAVEFFDIFNHRMAMLFYYAWEKYRAPVAYERRPEHDLFPKILLSLVGLGGEHLQNRQTVYDALFLQYASILAIQPRSASALENILSDYFGVTVKVLQFVGSWYQLDQESTTQFRDEDTESERLGYGVVVSDEYWSQEFLVRLRIGPLDLKTYRRFLDGGSRRTQLEAICRFFSREEFIFEAQLILRRDQVPETLLSLEEDSRGSQLGWTTWAKSAPFEQDAQDVIIRLA